MQIKEFLNHICEQIKYQPIRKEISEEIESHLLEAKESYLSEGMQELQAEEQAIKQMGNAEEIGKKLNKIHCPKLDWKLLLLTFILIIFGTLVTSTRAINYAYVYERYTYFYAMKQYIFTVIIGVIFSVSIYFLDYRKLFNVSKYFYGLATLLMTVVVMFGYQINGARSYITILGNGVYAPIVALPLYILAFVGFVQKIDKGKSLKVLFFGKEVNINLDVLKIIFLSAISLILFALIPATVSMCVLGMVYLIIASVKLLESKKNKAIYISILWGIPIIFGVLLIIWVKPMVFDRIMLSFHPERDAQGGGWIGVNQKMILESANLLGEADNMSNALNVFDEGTNFAFISILAHYGWMVSGGMVIAVVAFSIKLMINAIKIKDMYGRLMIVGISSLFILQSIFNLLMNLNLGIKSNINMPFISYGRQDLMMNMMCLALVLSVYRRKDILLERKKQMV